MQRKTGVTVEGLTPSQASGDPPSDFDDDEIESELHKAFALEVDMPQVIWQMKLCRVINDSRGQLTAALNMASPLA
ncbi:hypothetical protein M5K25_027367 [Dendrobium thyrsiflorum]|uniref:Uncharacterized protein n=1 Tax=Dendrobium thyrsiflorum TaxID=117978 RepID=A0ABD0U054_DENTH